MKKVGRYIVIIMLLMIGSFVNVKISNAASAGIEISADKSSVTVGDTIDIYVTITSDTMFADVEANIIYDDDIIEYQGGASMIAGGSGFLKITDMHVSDAGLFRKYALRFKALQVGSCDISLSEMAMVYDYETEIEMPVSSNIFSVEVKPAQSASTNTYLKSLKIKPSELEPVFDKNTYSYKATVDNDTTKLIVDALAEDSKSTVKVTGNSSFVEGENNVIITVIAESGEKKEYTIIVNREAKTELPDNEAVTPEPVNTKNVFTIIREDSELFAVYGGKYRLIEPDSKVVIPDGYKKDEIIISDISITAYRTDDIENEFLLIYAVNEEGKAGFYRYDRIERTMQRYVPEKPVVIKDNSYNEPSKDEREYRSNMNKALIIIGILCTICVILMVLLVRILAIKKNRKRK